MKAEIISLDDYRMLEQDDAPTVIICKECESVDMFKLSDGRTVCQYCDEDA